MQIKILSDRTDHLVAWLAALAIMIHVIESAIPAVLPGMKPGLANIITIAVLVLFGWSMAAWVSLLRVLVGSLLLGTFLSPTFLMSFSGALASILVLWFALKVPGKGFSAIGFSLLAAMAHMTGQFICAWLLFIPHNGLWHLYPVLMTIAIVLGIINGILCQRIIDKIDPEVCKTS
jgi:heptaprenyl diphosphate synthase